MRKKTQTLKSLPKNKTPSKPKIKQKALGSIHILLKLSNLILFLVYTSQNLGTPGHCLHFLTSPLAHLSDKHRPDPASTRSAGTAISSPPLLPHTSPGASDSGDAFSFFPILSSRAPSQPNSPASLGLSQINSLFFALISNSSPSITSNQSGLSNKYLLNKHS